MTADRPVDSRPRFELRNVFADGEETLGVYSLEEVAGQFPEMALNRRSFIGLAALLGGAATLVGCSRATPRPTRPPTLAVTTVTPPPSSTPAPTLSPAPTWTRIPTRTVSPTRPTSTPFPTKTSTATPTKLIPLSGECDGIAAHVGAIHSVAFSPNGNLLLSVSDDEKDNLHLWSTRDWSLQASLSANGPLYCLAITPDGATLATGGMSKVIQLWSLAGRNVIGTLDGHTNMVFSLAISPDGKYLASAASEEIYIWTLKDRKAVQKLAGPPAYGHVPMAFSPDGLLLATSTSKKEINLWNTGDWSLARTLSGHYEAVADLAFSPDGSRIASVGGIGWEGRIWDVKTGQAQNVKFDVAQGEGVTSVLAFSPDGQYLLKATVSNIKFLPMDPSKDGYLLESAPNVHSLSFSPDGRLLALGSLDHSLRIWNWAEGQPALRSCLFDRNSTLPSISVITYRVVISGVEQFYVLPKTSVLPAGAICTCNSVAGVYKPPPSGGPGGCSCVPVCTCVPVRKYCFVMFKEQKQSPS